MKLGRIAVDAVDGVQVLRAGGHDHNHIAQGFQPDPILRFRNSGFKGRAAIGGDRNVHPEVEGIGDRWGLQADGHEGHAQIISAVIVILLAAQNLVAVDIAAR